MSAVSAALLVIASAVLGEEQMLPPTEAPRQPRPGEPAYDIHRSISVQTTKKKKRTTPYRISFAEECHYIAKYCMLAYETGSVCGRSQYYQYLTYPNYCMLDYVNCMERYDMWQIAYLGPCFNITIPSNYIDYPNKDDHFLEQYYIFE